MGILALNKMFLGKKIVGLEYPLQDNSNPVLRRRISSIDSYTGAHVTEVGENDISKLHLKHFRITQFCPGNIIGVEGGNKYYPTRVYISALTKPRHIDVELDEFVFMDKIGRPSQGHIINHLLTILSKEFPGSYQIQVGRYVFNFNGLLVEILNLFLTLAKKGKGDIIDYTWIAAFQDLIEEKETVAKKPRPKQVVNPNRKAPAPLQRGLLQSAPNLADPDYDPDPDAGLRGILDKIEFKLPTPRYIGTDIFAYKKQIKIGD